MYLQEVQKDYISLTGIGDTLGAFNLHWSLVYHVKLLSRDLARKGKVMASIQVTLSATNLFLSSIQEDLEYLCSENYSLAQKLNELSTVGITTISESLDNAFLQVFQFHSPLRTSREQVRLN